MLGMGQICHFSCQSNKYNPDEIQRNNKGNKKVNRKGNKKVKKKMKKKGNRKG